MEDKEFELEKEEISKEVDEDIGLFDPPEPTYQIWMLGYDADQNITDFSRQLVSYKDPEKAIDYAKCFVDENKIEYQEIPTEVKYIEVLVETVVNLEGFEENVGTLFSETLKL